MLKQIEKLGKTLTRNEQKSINGGKLNANPEDPICACYQIIWGSDEPLIDALPDGPTGLTPSHDYSNGAIPIGYSAIIPTPECCK